MLIHNIFSNLKRLIPSMLQMPSGLKWTCGLWKFILSFYWMSFRKRTFGHVRLAMIQISLHTPTVWSESSLGIFWTTKNAKFLHADNDDSDQTARMHRLIGVIVGYTGAWRWIISTYRACPYDYEIIVGTGPIRRNYPTSSSCGGVHIRVYVFLWCGSTWPS